MERTALEQAAQSPLKVKFGRGDDAKEFDIPILVLEDEIKWRDRFLKEVGEVLVNFNATIDHIDMLRAGLLAGLIKFPDKLLELLFAYAPSLPREEILHIGSREQVHLAIEGVMAITFPHGGQLNTMVQLVKAEAIGSLTGNFSRSPSSNGT